jgi:hypothetical protein
VLNIVRKKKKSQKSPPPFLALEPVLGMLKISNIDPGFATPRYKFLSHKNAAF